MSDIWKAGDMLCVDTETHKVWGTTVDLRTVCVGDEKEVEAATKDPDNHPDVRGKLAMVGVSIEDILNPPKRQDASNLPPVRLSLRGVSKHTHKRKNQRR